MKCVSIDVIEESFDLCDLEIEGGTNNYVAEGIVVHNTWACFGYHPNSDVPIITSKGQSAKGLAFKLNERNETNLYVRSFFNLTTPGTPQHPLWMFSPPLFVQYEGTTILDRLAAIIGDEQPLYILGEIFGPVQDLKYGFDAPQFRIFDIYVGEPGKGNYIDAEQLSSYCTAIGVQQVPVIYAGEFNKKIMEKVTTGKETISGKEMNIREGVVIKPAKERQHPSLGRVMLKSVSEDYLLRKGNATEFQ